MELKPGIFLDRDGVLIKDKGLITSIGDVEPIEGAKEALRIFNELGYKLFLVSNQSVVARGLLGPEACHALNTQILEALLCEKVTFSDISLCFHHLDAQVLAYRKNCPYRKPNNHALESFIEKHGIDRTKSFMIGDRESDIIAGNLSRVKTVLVGDQVERIKYFKDYDKDLKKEHHRALDLLEFAKLLKGSSTN